jgi:hypothetical protein
VAKKTRRGPTAKEALRALDELRKKARKSGLDKLSDKEIDQIIDETRKDIAAKKERKVKKTPKSGPKKRKAP